MAQISVGNTGTYVNMAQEQDALITKSGKIITKPAISKADKVAAAKELFKMLPKDMEIDLDQLREERILRKREY